LVFKKFGFKTPYQARQAVVHRHIMIGDRVIDIPSYTVTTREEENIRFTPESKIPEILEKIKDAQVESDQEAEITSENESEVQPETSSVQVTETKSENSSTKLSEKQANQ
jgi:small subunit ribosomal protein S4